MTDAPAPVVIGPVRSEGSRVVADVDGTEVWFESDDAVLVASPEAFGSAFLLAAAAFGRPVQLTGPVTRRWRRGARRALRVADLWWGWTAPPPTPSLRRARRRADRDLAVGLCFSGGADSLHALRATVPPPTVLVTVIGFDVDVDDVERAASLTADVRAVAAKTGTRSVIVRTDLRTHPLHRQTAWDRTHGGALAAVGHALAGELSTLCIAASHAYDRPHGHGSHWDLDPHWSSDVRIRHVGAERWRGEKLADLIDDPVANAHLRVCWEHRTAEVNCGRCEKCLRTAVDLLVAGGLDRFDRLPQVDVLPERLDALEHPGGSLIVFERELEHPLPEPVRRAVSDLVERGRACEAATE